jgi:RNA polymerase sigma factor (sigma-70 family)
MNLEHLEQKQRSEAAAKAWLACPTDSGFEALLDNMTPLVIHLKQKDGWMDITPEDHEQQVKCLVWKAVSTWDPSKSEYITYFYNIYRNYVSGALNKKNAQRRIPHGMIESLDVENADGESWDHSPTVEPDFDDFDLNAVLPKWKTRLSNRELQAVEMWLDGMTTVKIGRKLGIKRQQVSKAIEHALVKLRHMRKL